MSFRDALQKIINQPEKHESVLFFDKNVVIIKDLFPKSFRHLLVIPRASDVSHQHPLEVFNTHYQAFTGEELYKQLGEYVEEARSMILDSLSKEFNIKEEDKEAFIQRQYDFVKTGVHSVPSLRNLHIHVMTSDFNTPYMKNKKHYNSFNTKFFVAFEELDPFYNEKYCNLVNKFSDFDSDSDAPISGESDDESTMFIKHSKDETFLQNLIKNTPFKCSSCSETFGNSMVRLKEHLKIEFSKRFDLFDCDLETLKINNF
ncbi:HNT3 [Candida oxycetoniae]|uniref:HNT3 n=1 Tax=Candida oxycetoniae TaxID=497107 RepID=A0AAI9SW31_9ASCO|nr:HNT3 [Candida oxycetoniae]KAI3403785.2 HNT3 [Candida oxycetoniae]